MQKINACLWFDMNAEEAVNFYTSVFKNSKIIAATRYGEGAPLPAGTVLEISFELNGVEFTALNGGPEFKFSEAISFVVNCENQAEIDYLWDKLAAGGEIQQCGWLKDKFGLSWQIVPSALQRMMTDSDPAKSSRVMQAVLQMVKLDIPTLERAYRG
jgi:predicted 3-demethylubiquinone-9 3-methyltransferase (glyoxalase superfamily)